MSRPPVEPAAGHAGGAEDAAGDVAADPIAWLRRLAPWLADPALGTCIVGTQALALACRSSGRPGPAPRDLDLAWALDVDRGRALLEEHGVHVPTTDGNVERGTLAMKLGGQRIEVTSFRAGRADGQLRDRIRADLDARDMTTGAVAVELADGKVHDPHDGCGDFARRRIAPVGDPAARVREHPVRWLRYFRKAHEWQFDVDTSIRKLDLSPTLLDECPREAVAGEVRAALLLCDSPGRFFVDLHEVRGLLAHVAPELDLQFDGRPAGPQRWHPEISQALHMVMVLEWAAARRAGFDERDRLALMVAVLCHDLGKGYTDPDALPGHPGHEQLGVRPLAAMLDRLPGLADQRARSLARAVCELHVQVRRLDEHRPGTLARLHERWFRGKEFPVDLFATAVAADSAGRLGHEHEGERVRAQVAADVRWLRSCCAAVDAGALRRQHADVDAFRRALHEAMARAIDDGRRQRPAGDRGAD